MLYVGRDVRAQVRIVPVRADLLCELAIASLTHLHRRVGKRKLSRYRVLVPGIVLSRYRAIPQLSQEPRDGDNQKKEKISKQIGSNAQRTTRNTHHTYYRW